MNLPKLYAIIDVSCFAAPLRTTAAIVEYAREVAAGGATLIQYRNKVGTTREMLSDARELRRALGEGVTLIMNDRADICIAADYNGVHVGQDDLSPEGARIVIGSGRILGVSTHNLDQLKEADAGPADYIAYGPVFPTSGKRNPDPVVGLDGHSSRAGCYEEAASRHRRHHSRQRPLGNRCRRRLGRGYL